MSESPVELARVRDDSCCNDRADAEAFLCVATTLSDVICGEHTEKVCTGHGSPF